MPERDVVDLVRGSYGEGCFACGEENPHGLHLDGFRLDDDGWVRARFRPRPDHRGAGDTLHGGIAATALDEILVWAGILGERVVSVTGSLALRYRRPLAVDGEIEAWGRVERRSGRRLRVRGHLTSDGVVAVEGTGLYLVTQTVDALRPVPAPDPKGPRP